MDEKCKHVKVLGVLSDVYGERRGEVSGALGSVADTLEGEE